MEGETNLYKLFAEGEFFMPPDNNGDWMQVNSKVVVGDKTRITFNTAANFGGEGLVIQGEANFFKGVTRLEGPLETTGYVSMAAESTLEILPNKEQKPSMIGGEGFSNKGQLDINKDAEIYFNAPLSVEGTGILNVSDGGFVHFGNLPEGKIHYVGGEGLESAGKVDVQPGAEIDFAGPCIIDGAGMLNVTDGAQVAFDPLPPIDSVAQNHKIGGAGLENEGSIYIRPGVTMDATAPIKNNGNMKIGGITTMTSRRLIDMADMPPPGATLNVANFASPPGSGVEVAQGGTLIAAGLNPLPLIFEGSTLSGDGGKLKGTVKMSNNAIISPGEPSDTDTGRLTIDGDLEMDSTTVTEVTLIGKGADVVEISGNAQLAGKVKVDMKWRPEKDTSIPIVIVKGIITGTLACEGCADGDTITINNVRRLTDGVDAGSGSGSGSGSGDYSAAYYNAKGDGGAGAPSQGTFGDAESGETHMYGGTGAFTESGASDNSKPKSYVEIGSNSDITYGAGGNVFGGMGFSNAGTATFSSGTTEFKGPLASEGQMNVDSGATLQFNDATSGSGSGYHIGGTGMDAKGELDVFSDLYFEGRLTLSDTGFLDVSSSGSVAFDPLPAIDGVEQKHMLGGKGMANEGKIYIRPGVTMDATAPVTNSGEMTIGGEGADSTFNCASFSALPGGETSLNSGGMLVATGTDPLLFTGATLSGNGGTLKGNVKLASDAQLAPGNPKDATTAGKSQLTITGNLEMDATTVTKASVKATSTETTADKIVVSGTAKLAGTVTIDIKVRPEKDTVLELLTANAIEGTYASCTGCGSNDEIAYTTSRRRLGDGETTTVKLNVKGSGIAVTDSSSAADSGGAPVAVIAGGVVGVVVIGALVAMFMMKRSRTEQGAASEEQTITDPQVETGDKSVV
jgi:hypothetical protein